MTKSFVSFIRFFVRQKGILSSSSSSLSLHAFEVEMKSVLCSTSQEVGKAMDSGKGISCTRRRSASKRRVGRSVCSTGGSVIITCCARRMWRRQNETVSSAASAHQSNTSSLCPPQESRRKSSLYRRDALAQDDTIGSPSLSLDLNQVRDSLIRMEDSIIFAILGK